MEFDDFVSIEQMSQASPEERLEGIKGLFHEVMLNDEIIVNIVMSRLDKEIDAEKYLDGTIRMEPIYFVDDEKAENYGISLTRHLSTGKMVMAQPDPLLFGKLKSTGDFEVSQELASLLRKNNLFSVANVWGIIDKWQRATRVFYNEMPDEIAPDPTCYNTFRLKDEYENIAELLEQQSEEEDYS